jgi:hypothetical protein
MNSVVFKKETIILSAINDFLKTNFVSAAEVAGRCERVIDQYEKETFLIDGKPFIEFLAPVFINARDDAEKVTFKHEQQYRRLF